MDSLFLAVLVIVFLACLLLDRILHSITLKELKRRARAGDKVAKRLYKLAAFGPSSIFLLWLVAALCLSGIFLAIKGWQSWAIFLIAFVLLWLLWGVSYATNYGNWLWACGSYISLPFAKVVGWLQPFLVRFTGRFGKFRLTLNHAGIYEKTDLLELLNHQNKLVDNRVSESDLKLAFNALQFGDKTVGSVMLPRKSIRWVGDSESVGPLLMDELHASGFTEFPVVKDASKKSASPEILGTLYLTDLIGQAAGGKAKDFMHRGVHTIAETSDLRQALAVFSKNHQHLLIVMNNFDEAVGLLTLGQMAEQILGEKLNGNMHKSAPDAVSEKKQQPEKAEPEKP